MKKIVHFMLQGKGGCGKSLIASILAQHRGQSRRVLNIDTDPVNATFAGYEALEVMSLEIMKSNRIDPQQFDRLVEAILSTDAEEVIVDNGASSFMELNAYLLSHDIPSIFREEGTQMVIHTVIAGSQSLPDTLAGFRSVARHFQEHARLIVWLNTYFGAIEDEKGRTFEQMRAYRDFEQAIDGIIDLTYPGELFTESVRAMLQARKTFEQAMQSEDFSFMDRHRLKTVRGLLYEQLDFVLDNDTVQIAQNAD